MKRVGRFLALVMALGLLATPVGAAAHSTSRQASQAVTVATLTLSPDCSHLPRGPLAEGMLRRFGLCGFGSSTGPSANNTTYGVCGSLSILVSNMTRYYLSWRAEITSAIGPFVAANYTGTWANVSAYRSGTVNRSYLGVSSDWVDLFPIQTGPGVVIGRITFAKNVTFWGLICTNTSVVDSMAFVTI